MLAGLLYNLSS